MSFITIKTINNNHYFYEQTPHRDGENTTPIMKYIGPVFRRRKKGEEKREPIKWTNEDIEFQQRDPEGYKAYLQRCHLKSQALMDFLAKTGIYRETTCDGCKPDIVADDDGNSDPPKPISASPEEAQEKSGTLEGAAEPTIARESDTQPASDPSTTSASQVVEP